MLHTRDASFHSLNSVNVEVHPPSSRNPVTPQGEPSEGAHPLNHESYFKSKNSSC